VEAEVVTAAPAEVVQAPVDTPVAEVVSAPVDAPTEQQPEVAQEPALTDPVPDNAVAPQQPTQQKKKYPREGGKCWKVWNQCDILLANGTPPTVALLRTWATENNENVSNASQEFYAWRKYWGRK